MMSALPELSRRSLLAGGAGAFTLAVGVGTAKSSSAAPATELADRVDLGAPMRTVLVHEGAFGPGPQGLLGYAALQGDNAPLNVIDAATGEHRHTVPLPGASGAWGITVTPQGDVYLGTYYNGHLYHYSSETQQVRDLGQPVPGDDWLWGLTHDQDGNIYGGTYESASAFRYDPASGEYTNFGQFAAPNSPYVRATAFDDDSGRLFIGTGMADARLYAIDVSDGSTEEIPMPADWAGEAFIDLRVIDGRLFANVDSELVVFDTASGQRQHLLDGSTGAQVTATSMVSRAVSPPIDNQVYYTDVVGALCSLDLRTLQFEPAPVPQDAPSLPGAGIGFGVLDEDILVAWTGNSSGQGIHYRTGTGELDLFDFGVEPVPSQMLELIAARDATTVYLSAGQQGDFAAYDPQSDVAETGPPFGQVEGWIWHEGLLYSGTYPNGIIQVWDPANAETAPQVLATLLPEHQQNRPVALSAEGSTLFAGTMPGYGQHGGALTAVDLDSGSVEVHRHLAGEHSISALLADHGVVYGGSSIEGGGGTEPLDDQAQLFTFDPATGELSQAVVPVPDAWSVNALIRTRRGQYWGLADGVAFQFDPQNLRVLTTVELSAGNSGARDGALEETPRGLLYATTAHCLYAFDPRRVGRRHPPQLLAEEVFRTSLSADGSVYAIGLDDAGSGTWTRLLRLDP